MTERNMSAANIESNSALIPVEAGIIDGQTVRTVNARDLHAFLENRDLFANWIRYRIERYGFVEDRDFVSFLENTKKPRGGRPPREYAVTLGMAKELAMVERTERGKQARQYFIACERQAKASLDPVALGLPDFNNPIAAAQAWIEAQEGHKAAWIALEAVAPKVEAYDRFLGSKLEQMNLQRAMKVVGYGPNKAISVLRDEGVLYGTPATARQEYVDRGYFVMLPVEDRRQSGKIRPQTFVTAKGLDWLGRRLPVLMEREAAA